MSEHPHEPFKRLIDKMTAKRPRRQIANLVLINEADMQAVTNFLADVARHFENEQARRDWQAHQERQVD